MAKHTSTPNSMRRKLAIASWGAPREGNIYGKLTLNAAPALAYLDEVRERTGEKVTITHLVGKAVGRALELEPSLNGYIRFGRFHQHDDVALTFLVSMADGSDLARAKVDHVHRRSIAEIAAELRLQAASLRDGKDEDWESTKEVVRSVPAPLLKPLVSATGWLASALGAELPSLGVRAFPFGSAIITNVGVFGLDEAFVPPTPFARVPLYVLIGAVHDAATVAGDGSLTVTKQLTVTATIDHRFIDGFQGGVIAREFRRIFDDPWCLDGEP